MARDWRKAADYADLQDLHLPALAWEFLRRDLSYRETFQRIQSGAGDDAVASFGLRFAIDPDLDETRDLFWRPEIAPAHVVQLGAARGGTLRDALLRAAQSRRPADDGLHLRFAGGLQGFIPHDVDPAARLGVVLPLDAEVGARLAAAQALASQLAGRRAARDHLSRAGRRRLLMILRAADARAEAASYRDVAVELLGAEADDPLAWRTSPLRDVAIRLCRAGKGLMAGGYRRLLVRR